MLSEGCSLRAWGSEGKNITTSLQDLINFITKCWKKNKGHQKFNNNYKKVNKGKQNSISHSVKFVYKNYTYVPNFTSIRQKTIKVTRRSEKVRGQFTQLIKFVEVNYTYIPNFVSVSWKTTKGHQKVNDTKKRSVSNLGQICIHKYYIPTKFHSN